VGADTAFVTDEALTRLVSEVEQALLAFHAAEPKATGIATAALRGRIDRRLSAKAFDAVLAVAVARGVAVIDRAQVRHPKAAVSALAEEDAAAKALLPLLERQGLAPAGVGDIAAEAGVDAGVARRVLGKLGAEGRVVRIGGDMYFSAEAIEQGRQRLVAFLSERSEGSNATELKEPLGVSRKYAIPLLEYFDSIGVTKRVGDLRVLRKG
jgi:selenocysteine-specific elongation factor